MPPSEEGHGAQDMAFLVVDGGPQAWRSEGGLTLWLPHPSRASSLVSTEALAGGVISLESSDGWVCLLREEVVGGGG
jgi:hypothetical protein